MGGSIKKGQIGHFVVSIAKTLEQKENGTANMAILKSRFGKDGIIFNDIIFDNARIQIDMAPDSTMKTQQEYNKDKETSNIVRLNQLLETKKRVSDVLSGGTENHNG
jgi:hypothetical protein